MPAVPPPTKLRRGASATGAAWHVQRSLYTDATSSPIVLVRGAEGSVGAGGCYLGVIWVWERYAAGTRYLLVGLRVPDSAC